MGRQGSGTTEHRIVDQHPLAAFRKQKAGCRQTVTMMTWQAGERRLKVSQHLVSIGVVTVFEKLVNVATLLAKIDFCFELALEPFCYLEPLCTFMASLPWGVYRI